INYQVIKTNGLVFRPPCYHSLERTDRTAFPPSQPHQLFGQPGRRPDCLLSSAEKAFSWPTTSHAYGGVAYPELTLNIPFIPLLYRIEKLEPVGPKKWSG
ncbi:MAG: hypothetical protein ACXWPS_18800, partial [Ktedonobacteraceae bacterium]